MRRRDFLRCLAAGTLTGACGRYLPDEHRLEVSTLQSRAAEIPFNQLMWQAADRLTQAHPTFRVEPASGGGGGYQELMIRVMEGNPPDVMTFATAETGLTYAYVEQGHVLDFTDYLNMPAYDTPGASWLETIDPLYYGTFTYKNRFWGVPQNVISLQIYCNAALYERVGATLEPKTWDEFLDNCARLKAAGIIPITQDGIHWYTSWWFDHLAQRLVGTAATQAAFRDQSRSVNWTDPGFLEAARLVGGLLDRGYFPEGFAGLNHIESELLFWQGRAATVFVGTWFTSGRTEVMGDDFRLYAYRFPEVTGGQGNPHELIGTVQTLSIPARARHPDLAAELLRIITSRWFQAQMVEKALMVSPLVGAELPAVQQGLKQILQHTTRFHPFSFGLEGAYPFLYRQYWNEWNRYMVAREIEAEQLVQNLELIFARYYQQQVG